MQLIVLSVFGTPNYLYFTFFFSKIMDKSQFTYSMNPRRMIRPPIKFEFSDL